LADDLTPRQEEIARLVARGLSNKAIARRKGISIHTVKRHVSAAASRIQGRGRPRYRIILWHLSQTES
jgi:DNA-binding NarL/FixJ family response regulator